MVGLPVMAGSKKKRQDSLSTDRMMPKVVSTATPAQAMRSQPTNVSTRLRARKPGAMARQTQAKAAAAAKAPRMSAVNPTKRLAIRPARTGSAAHAAASAA